MKIFPKFYQDISLNWAKGTNDVTPKTSNGHNFGLDYRRPTILYTFGIRSSGSNQLLQLHLCLTNLNFSFALKWGKAPFLRDLFVLIEWIGGEAPWYGFSI